MSDERAWEMTLIATELTDEEAGALFDRVAEIAHSGDLQVICSARKVSLDELGFVAPDPTAEATP